MCRRALGCEWANPPGINLTKQCDLLVILILELRSCVDCRGGEATRRTVTRALSRARRTVSTRGEGMESAVAQGSAVVV